MRIRIDHNLDELLRYFPLLEKEIQRESVIGMYRALSIVKAQVLQNIRKNSGLNVESGALFNSINTKIEIEKYLLTGYIYSRGVPYAETHEYGAIIPAKVITPKSKQALAWPGAGGTLFSKRNVVPSYSIPARPYMRPAIEAKADEIYNRFGLIIDKALGD